MMTPEQILVNTILTLIAVALGIGAWRLMIQRGWDPIDMVCCAFGTAGLVAFVAGIWGLLS